MADQDQTPTTVELAPEPAPVPAKPAPKCDGCDDCGFVDKQEQKPWSRFAGQHVPGIHTGEIEIIDCPKCKPPKNSSIPKSATK